MLNLPKFFRSFRHAGRGFMLVFRQEQNFRIQVIASIVVLIIAFLLQISSHEFIAIILSISILLILEVVNTSLEKVIDVIKPRVHHYAAEIKDILAAAVTIAAISCAIVVVLVFSPYVNKILLPFVNIFLIW